MTQIRVIKTANRLLQYCATIRWWNCFANDVLKLQTLKIRTFYSFYHHQHRTRAQFCLNLKQKFSNKSGLFTLPSSRLPPPPPSMSWMGKENERSSIHISEPEPAAVWEFQWGDGALEISTTLSSQNAAESQDTIRRLSKQKQNKKANIPSVLLPVMLQLRERRALCAGQHLRHIG